MYPRAPAAIPEHWRIFYLLVPSKSYVCRYAQIIYHLVIENNYGTSPCLMGKPTLNGHFHPFSIVMLVSSHSYPIQPPFSYGFPIHIPLNHHFPMGFPIQIPFNHYFPMVFPFRSHSTTIFLWFSHG